MRQEGIYQIYRNGCRIREGGKWTSTHSGRTWRQFKEEEKVSLRHAEQGSRMQGVFT